MKHGHASTGQLKKYTECSLSKIYPLKDPALAYKITIIANARQSDKVPCHLGTVLMYSSFDNCTLNAT